MNFGASKGTGYERVLIVPTKAIQSFLFDGSELKPKSAARFYVAVTRAEQSVAIVLDRAPGQQTRRWQPVG